VLGHESVGEGDRKGSRRPSSSRELITLLVDLRKLGDGNNWTGLTRRDEGRGGFVWIVLLRGGSNLSVSKAPILVGNLQGGLLET